MDALSIKTSCSMCQLLLEDEPKVLPGCLHVFCLSCLNKLPIAFSTRSRDEPEGDCTSQPDPDLTQNTGKVEHEVPLKGASPTPVGWLAVDKNHFGTIPLPIDTCSPLPDNSLDLKLGTPPDLDAINSKPNNSESCSFFSDQYLSISCPKCRRTSSVPHGGFRKFQTSYVTSNMAATYKAVKVLQIKLPGQKCEQCVDQIPAASYCATCQQLICEDHLKCHRMWKEYAVHQFFPISSLSTGKDGHMIKLLTPFLSLGEFKCSKHSRESDNRYKFFCSTCEDLACTYCTLSTHKDGPNHTCVTVTPEIVSEKRQSVMKALERLNNLVDDLDALAGEIQTQYDLITKRATSVKDSVDAVFTEIIDTLHSRKLALFDEVDMKTSSPLTKLNTCSKNVDTFKQHVLESRNFVQDNLNSEGDLGLLSVAGVISGYSLSVEQEYRELLPKGKVQIPKIDFVEGRDRLYDCIATFGNVHSNQPTDETHKTSYARTPPLYQKLQQTATLSRSRAYQSSLEDIFSANLVDSLTGTYVYPPPILPYSDDTTSPVVTDVPMVAGVHVRTLEGLNRPSGIRVDDSFRVIACEFGTHQVFTFDQSGVEVADRVGRKGDRNGQFLYPQCTYSDGDGKMLVVDSCYRVQLFDKGGKFLRSVGSKGKGCLQFMDPVSVVMSPDKRVFVCERENHRIQVLKSDLSFSHFIGKPGRKECEFYLPNDIAITRCGHLYVADSGNHRIQILTLDGSFIGTFGKKGSGLGQLCHPTHLCVDSEGVFVSEEGNHRVSVFNLNGVFIRTIGQKGVATGQFNRPMGVAIDRNKSLYVSDSKNNRIQVFK